MNNEKSKCSILPQSVYTSDIDEDDKSWLQQLKKPNDIESTSTPVSKDRQIIVESLIEAVKSRESLWNVDKCEYKNRQIRPKLWKEIAREINYSEEHYLDLRKKWSMIKTAYSRSKIGAPSGPGYYRRPYKFARFLSFLDDTSQSQATPFPSSSDESTCGSSSQLGPSRSKRSSHLKRRFLESHENKELRSEDYFGQFVTAELLKIPQSRRSKLQLEIMQSICNAKSETYE